MILRWNAPKLLILILSMASFANGAVDPLSVNPKPCSLLLTESKREFLTRYHKWDRVGLARETQKLGTNLYFLEPTNPMAGFPEIEADAAAIVIALPGTAAKGSSGMSFTREMSGFWGYRTSLISIDYPYHGRGPKDPKYQSLDEVLRMLKGIVSHYKQTGKPVVLLGHSFGTNLIQEFGFQYPLLADAAVSMGPTGGHSTELLEHFKTFLESEVYKDFINNFGVEIDPLLEGWEKRIISQMKSTDRTLPENHFPILVLYGSEDIWCPPNLVANLANQYPNGSFNLMSGLGHLELLTKNSDVVGSGRSYQRHFGEFMRSLGFTGVPPKVTGASAFESSQAAYAQIRRLYHLFPEFRIWVAPHGIPTSQSLTNLDPYKANGILNDWRIYIHRVLQHEAAMAVLLDPLLHSRPEFIAILTKTAQEITSDEYQTALTYLLQR